MIEETFRYDGGGIESEGFAARPETDEPRPMVLVIHAFMGLQELTRKRARALAELGYVGVCADLYGVGVRAADRGEASKLMAPFLEDRGMLRDRLFASLAAARTRPGVDPTRVAAIGYCFGGLCALDLLRAGADVKGVVSFHGLLGGHDFGDVRPTGSALVLHGYAEPLAPPASVLEFGEEFTKLGVDWQLHAHGHAMHAYTTPGANEPESGIQYDERADRRSWTSMVAFLEEVLA